MPSAAGWAPVAELATARTVSRALSVAPSGQAACRTTLAFRPRRRQGGAAPEAMAPLAHAALLRTGQTRIGQPMPRAREAQVAAEVGQRPCPVDPAKQPDVARPHTTEREIAEPATADLGTAEPGTAEPVTVDHAGPLQADPVHPATEKIQVPDSAPRRDPSQSFNRGAAAPLPARPRTARARLPTRLSCRAYTARTTISAARKRAPA